MAVNPPGRAIVLTESPEAGEARYQGIATAIDEVVSDPAEPPLFGGRQGRAHTAMLLAAISWHESGWRRDVDLGVGPFARGDHGRSCSLFQFQLGAQGRTIEGWNCVELVSDRAKAARAALHMVRRSQAACPGAPSRAMLATYASGSCTGGLDESKAMVDTARRWLARHPPPAPP